MSGLFGGSASRIFEATRPTQNALLDFQSQAVNDEATAEELQANIAQTETQQEIAQKARDIRFTMGEQSQAYLSSGVTLQGTPLDVLNSTRQQGQQELDALASRGSAIADLMRRKAAITRNQGRAAILGSRFNYGVQEAQAKLAESRLGGGVLSNIFGSAASAIAKPLFSAIFNP